MSLYLIISFIEFEDKKPNNFIQNVIVKEFELPISFFVIGIGSKGDGNFKT